MFGFLRGCWVAFLFCVAPARFGRLVFGGEEPRNCLGVKFRGGGFWLVALLGGRVFLFPKSAASDSMPKIFGSEVYGLRLCACFFAFVFCRGECVAPFFFVALGRTGRAFF